MREGEDTIVKKYKVDKWPSLVIIKANQNPIKFEGTDFTYPGLFDFINVHSQIFVDPNS